ncbi:hypothetical protein FRC04_003083 [Tulasnella sp. 424]|nr:hypothetical protein FRC04_003083 [Tulasnella sp. 424]
MELDDDIEYDDTPYDNTNIQPISTQDNRDGSSDHKMEEDHQLETSEAKPPTPTPPPPPPPRPPRRHLLVKGPIRRNYLKFPIIRPLEHLKKYANIDYDYYAQRPQGYRISGWDWKWSLYKNDWYYMVTVPGVLVLVGRSILLEMGIANEELPPPGDQDLEEAKGLPEKPIRMEAWHQLKDHSADVCYWPEMTEDPKYIPVLDRSLAGYFLDSLVVHDPQNVTYLQPQSKSGSSRRQSSNSLLKADFREEDYTIKYIRVDPTIIGIPWVPLPPKSHQLVGHLHLSASEQAGIGHSAAAWDAKLDLPYALVNALLHRCYRDSSEAHNDWDRECPNPYQPTEADLTGNPDEPSHRRDGLPTRFRVIAKVAAMERESHNFINNEAKAYWRMPKTFSEQWSGYQLVPHVHLPQPAAAIVPITFGYYVPDNCGKQLDVETRMDKLHIEYKYVNIPVPIIALP